MNRYHILGPDLISPVDKYRKFYRSKSVRPMSSSDLLIGSMAIHLSHIHGRDQFLLLTADPRMAAIFGSVGPKLNKNTAVHLGLTEKARQLGFGEWAPELLPRVLNLRSSSGRRLHPMTSHWIRGGSTASA